MEQGEKVSSVPWLQELKLTETRWGYCQPHYNNAVKEHTKKKKECALTELKKCQK